ncbi:UNVERIFIED_CONTAM: sensor histidine kinase regulating citrate/malate metabolism [Streptomyces graminofaciens]
MSPVPTAPARRRRIGWPQRVFSQVLLMQLTIVTGVIALATGLFLAPLSAQLDDQAMRRALAIAETTASPELAEDVTGSRPTPDGPVQAEAERIRQATGAEYIVVMDGRGVRWSHTSPAQIGRIVSTDPSEALAGRDVMEIDSGTLGRSARGKVPLRDADGRIVGAVSVGIEYDSVRARLLAAIPGLLAYAGGALAVGALAAYLISRRLQRQTHDLAFSDISALLAEREAMLHGIREGVVALDAAGRVRLLNDEAQRLLGLGQEAIGRPLDEVLGEGRTSDVLAGRVNGDDLLAVRGSRVLVANRMPTDDGGAVVTLRDRTELEQLGRELDSTRGLIDALRARRTTSTPTACTPCSACWSWRCTRRRWSSSPRWPGCTGRPRSRSRRRSTIRCSPRCSSARRRSRRSAGCRCGSPRRPCCPTGWWTRADW